MHTLFRPLLFTFAIALVACAKQATPPQQLPQPLFDSIPAAVAVPSVLKGASGIAGSKSVPQTLWVEEDSGNPPQLYSLNYDGSIRKKVYIKGTANRDWEDIARSGDTLYVAETGDNNQVYTGYAIYKFAEPAADADTVYTFKKISFKYPDGAHDAEALLVDPSTRDIYVITKRDNPSRLYKIQFPYSTTTNIAVMAGQLSFNGVVSAALSPDGKEILVKTYTNLYHYKTDGKSIEAALQSAPAMLPYTAEPQGEAVTFAQDNSGFFTLSEKGLGSTVNLYFYKRH